MTPDSRRQIDGFSYIRRGIHSGVSPNQLAPDQLAFAVNTVLRTGLPTQRPGLVRRDLTFLAYGDEESDHYLSPAQVQSNFEDGFWQGGFAYKWDKTSLLLASISGRFYVINPATLTVKDLTIPGKASQPWSPQVWMEQAEMFVIRQDGGQSVPLIFDGTTLRESNIAAGEVPGGCMMKYALGRLWLVLPTKRDFIAGDLVFGPSGTIAYGYRDSVLKFTENDFLNEGGAFTVGDEINALRQQATIDTTLGQGPLAVFFNGGAALVNAPFDRTLWKVVEYPIQTVGSLAHGALSHFSTLNINNDIWYRADDGIRSFKAARREDDSWGSTPMSYEMDRVIRFDQTDLLGFGSAVLFGNRLLMTASPFIVPLRGVPSRGLISLDFQQVSSLQRDRIPAYDGLWTGLRVLFITTLNVARRERGFIFALDSDDKISLYEIEPTSLYDGDGTQRIQWNVETPSYRFGSEGIAKTLKKLQGANLFRSQLNSETDFCVSFRADNYPVYNESPNWCWSDCATQACLFDDCSLVSNASQYRPPKLLTQPADDCEEGGSVKLARLGFEFQFKIDVEGPARLDLFRPWAYDFPEPRYEQCAAEGECYTFRACSGYLFDYEIEA